MLSASMVGMAADVNLNDYKLEADPLVSLRFDARFDGTGTWYGKKDGVRPESDWGFTGAYLMLKLDGQINDKFTYSFSHRLYKDNGEEVHFMSATDWAWLSYKATDRLTLVGGKQVAMIGTIEYDYAPIDVYFASDFWNHTGCYQIGVSAGYEFLPHNVIWGQVCNSIFSHQNLDKMLAYNLFWNGHPVSWLNTLYSANMIEYQRGHFINYIALGNRANLGRVAVDLDYMNRYGGKGTAFFKDFTVTGKVDVNVTDHWTVFAKGGYDQNKAQKPDADFIIDRTVLPGVSRGFYGIGAEYSAFVNNRNAVRLFGVWHAATEGPQSNTIMVGLRWQMDALKIVKK